MKPVNAEAMDVSSTSIQQDTHKNLSNDIQPIHRWLGYAGLLPFVLPSVLLLAEVGPSEWWQTGLEAYSFGIASFLLGAWWRQEASSQLPLWLSNALFLLLFFAFITVKKYFLLIAALLFVVIFVCESSGKALNVYWPSYRKLRLHLTCGVVASLLLGFWGTQI